jgi:hypothetical protein
MAWVCVPEQSGERDAATDTLRAKRRCHIAYQSCRDGPFDLVFVPGFISHLDLQWADPRIARFLEKLASRTQACSRCEPSGRSSAIDPLVVLSVFGSCPLR